MDVEEVAEAIEQLLDQARPVPLSASVLVNRLELEDLVAELRAALPEELRQARWVLKERDELLEQAARERNRLLAEAREEQDRLVLETTVVRAAQREAERIVADARERARVLRLEAEDYVDGKLAGFAGLLGKTLATVEEGRRQLQGPPPEQSEGDADDRLLRGRPTQFYDQEARGRGPDGS